MTDIPNMFLCDEKTTSTTPAGFKPIPGRGYKEGRELLIKMGMVKTQSPA